MLPLSDAQARVLDSWRRATEISEEISMKQEEPMDLAQDAITDCSIVASMCAAVSSEERGHAKVNMHPLEVCKHQEMLFILKTDCLQYYLPSGSER